MTQTHVDAGITRMDMCDEGCANYGCELKRKAFNVPCFFARFE